MVVRDRGFRRGSPIIRQLGISRGAMVAPQCSACRTRDSAFVGQLFGMEARRLASAVESAGKPAMTPPGWTDRHGNCDRGTGIYSMEDALRPPR